VQIKLSHVQAAAITVVAAGGMLAFYPPAILFGAGLACAGVASYELLNGPKNNTGKVQEVFEAVNYKNKNDKYPVKLNKSDLHLVYELPPGRCPEEYGNIRLKRKTQNFFKKIQKSVDRIKTIMVELRQTSEITDRGIGR